MDTILKKSIIAVIFVFCVSENVQSSNEFDRMFLAGLSLSYNDRLGHLSLSNNKTQDIDRENLTSFGIVLGKRFRLPFRWRLQIPFILEGGRVKIDDNEAYKSFDVTVKTSILHFGLLPELQFPLRINSQTGFYMSFGCGLSLVRFAQKDINESIYSSTTLSPSVNGGAGFEFLRTENSAMSIQYSIRYGKPVYHKYMKNIFPFEAVSYYEKFLTHSLQVLILIGK